MRLGALFFHFVPCLKMDCLLTGKEYESFLFEQGGFRPRNAGLTTSGDVQSNMSLICTPVVRLWSVLLSAYSGYRLRSFSSRGGYGVD